MKLPWVSRKEYMRISDLEQACISACAVQAGRYEALYKKTGKFTPQDVAMLRHIGEGKGLLAGMDPDSLADHIEDLLPPSDKSVV